MKTPAPADALIDLRQHLTPGVARRIYTIMAPVVHRALRLGTLHKSYEETRRTYLHHPAGQTLHTWLDSVLQVNGARYEVVAPTGLEVPMTGPLVIVANHPFGLLDPVMLGHFLSRTRPDLRFLANALLGRIEELREHLIQVNPFGGSRAIRSNLPAMKEAIIFLRQGGALAVFPSGEVAHYQPGRGIIESPWSSHLGALIRRAEATVLPIFVSGHNSLTFHAAGLVHKRLRTGMLVREFVNSGSRCVELKVGRPIPFTRLKKFEDDESLTAFLRLQTLVLGRRPSSGAASPRPKETPSASGGTTETAREVERLRQSGAMLASQSHLSVFAAEADEIPACLNEIGRLREITFRAAGEGTGKEVDLDAFDRYYLHLFLWDEQNQRIAGAYRLGRADEILRRHGCRGLYTSTLFKFQKAFLRHLDDAVEMGRSFITPEYQRHHAALPLLWRGIAAWMGRNPRYTKLFGPVSISQDYDRLSRRLIVQFMEDQCRRPDLAAQVRPRSPFRSFGGRKLLLEFVSARLKDVDDCSAIVSSLESDGKGLPVLLKHYLRLNGTILSFNVDKDFSSVLDGLIIVDLREADSRMVARMMGAELWPAYAARHGIPPESAQGKAGTRA